MILFLVILLALVLLTIYAWIVVIMGIGKIVRRMNARKEADRIIRGEKVNHQKINHLIDILGEPVVRARWGRVKEDDFVRIGKLRQIRDQV